MTKLYDRNGNEFRSNATIKGKPVLIRDRPCTRCGGAGGAKAWEHTGWTCYRCGGKCVDPNRETIKLYTAEQNAKLDAIALKKADKRAAAALVKAQAEQERRDAEKAELLATYATYIKRLETELAFGEIEIIRSVLERITVQVKHPTERQVEVVEEIISRNEKERARREVAGFVGEIGQRMDFTLTLIFAKAEQTGQFPTIWSYWFVFRDETGNTIVSSSLPGAFGLASTYKDGYTIGQQVKVKATVIKHYVNSKGEQCTKINRPKTL